MEGSGVLLLRALTFSSLVVLGFEVRTTGSGTPDRLAAMSSVSDVEDVMHISDFDALTHCLVILVI